MANQHQRKPQGDATGRAKQEAEQQAADEARDRQDEITMVNQQRAEIDRTGVFDATSGEVIAESDDDLDDDVLVIGENDGEVTDVGVEVVDDDETEKKVVWRSNGDYPNVTIGVGNTMSFEQGKRYSTSVHVYNHMEEKGCVWH